jgi:hypothetical protein
MRENGWKIVRTPRARLAKPLLLAGREEIVMKSVFILASFLTALAFGAPGVAAAQEPKRSPKAAAPPDAPTQPAAQESAVPRQVAAPREAAPKETPRTETRSGEGTRLPPPPTASGTNASTAEDQDRRGAVRRPPSGGSGRGGQTPRDRAVARTSPPPRDYDGDRDYVYYYPSYYSYGRYYDPYYYGGLHLGYLAYSPWGWMPAFYGYPYGYGGVYPYGGYDFGSLKIKVKPRDAEVYVDGYFAGNVDDFDGTFQSLRLETGGYKIEIRKPGFETLYFDVHVQPDRTITYRGELRAAP